MHDSCTLLTDHPPPPHTFSLQLITPGFFSSSKFCTKCAVLLSHSASHPVTAAVLTSSHQLTNNASRSVVITSQFSSLFVESIELWHYRLKRFGFKSKARCHESHPETFSASPLMCLEVINLRKRIVLDLTSYMLPVKALGQLEYHILIDCTASPRRVSFCVRFLLPILQQSKDFTQCSDFFQTFHSVFDDKLNLNCIFKMREGIFCLIK